MKIISTLYVLTDHPSQKGFTGSFVNVSGEAKMVQFKYKVPFANHFKYSHDVDYHNNMIYSKPHLRETWLT